jgi:sugar/nucleoside kinase (ribokinase family)
MASAAPSPDYLVVGHLSLDQSPSGPSLGGTAAYAALTAAALGRHPAVVTSADESLDLTPLAGVPLRRLPSDQSTAFRNEYGPDGRRQVLLARARPLSPDDIPGEWHSSAIVHLAPIAGEMAPSMAAAFAGPEVLGLTPQGWMRAWDEAGRVSVGSWTAALPAMERADVVIVGVEDVNGDESELERLAGASRLLVATEGARGARVYWNHDVRRFPAPEVEAVDPTGAGDVFAAAFFIRFADTRDPWEAARFANILASNSVRRRGLDGVPTPEEAHQAAWVWSR